MQVLKVIFQRLYDDFDYRALFLMLKPIQVYSMGISIAHQLTDISKFSVIHFY